MKSPEYQLAKDVFACHTGKHLVFLDLRRNRYICLNAANTMIATRALGGFEESATAPEKAGSVSTAHDTDRIIRALREGGLVARSRQDGNGAIPIRANTDNVLLSLGRREDARLCVYHRATFLHGSLKASVKLRWYSMHRTVRSIENRKRRRPSPDKSSCDGLSELVHVFSRLRPYYPRRYLCLYDSLALIEFLAKYHHFPQWVFGVQTEPFNAHCWVESSGHVLNDDVENVRYYTPIMTV